MDNTSDVLVVGAGVSGLALAGELVGRGLVVTVLDQARGVGGRCATRRVHPADRGERPGLVALDHGVPYLHGSSRPFLAQLDRLPGASDLPPWPREARGNGTPCQPQAYREGSRRLAPAAGVSALPKSMARGLDLRLESRADTIRRVDGLFEVRCGELRFAAQSLVLTPPVPQTTALLHTLGSQRRELRAVLEVLDGVFMLPCLAVLAGYQRPPADDWHLWLPGPRSPIHTLVNDSAKRPGARDQTLVIQADPRFSRENLDDDPERWSVPLLQSAARLLGDWAERPSWSQGHCWRHARVQRGHELSHPVLLRWPDGATLGLCGEAFNPTGGVEGALLAGLELAQRMRAKNATQM